MNFSRKQNTWPTDTTRTPSYNNGKQNTLTKDTTRTPGYNNGKQNTLTKDTTRTPGYNNGKQNTWPTDTTRTPSYNNGKQNTLTKDTTRTPGYNNGKQNTLTKDTTRTPSYNNGKKNTLTKDTTRTPGYNSGNQNTFPTDTTSTLGNKKEKQNTLITDTISTLCNNSGKQNTTSVTGVENTPGYNSGNQTDSSTDTTNFTGAKNNPYTNTKSTPDNTSRKQPEPFNNMKSTLRNNKGFSLLEVLLASGIMLIIIIELTIFLTSTMKINNLIHSQLSESDFRKFAAKSLNGDGCTNTFTGNIGDSVSIIKDTDDKTIWQIDTNRDGDLTDLKDGLFNTGFKIIKIITTPTEPDPTPGYANMQVFFSRPGGTFPTTDKNLECSTTDQTGCYKQVCLMKLLPKVVGNPVPPGTEGTQVQKCILLSCAGRGGEEGAPHCYQVEDDRTLVGCGTTTDTTIEGTTAYGFNAGNIEMGSFNTFIGYEAGKEIELRKYIPPIEHNTVIGYQAGKGFLGEKNTLIGSQVNTREYSKYYHKQIGYTGRNNVAIGYGVITSRDYNVVIGNEAGAFGGSIAIGSGASAAGGSIAIGGGVSAGRPPFENNRINIGNMIYGTGNTELEKHQHLYGRETKLTPAGPGVTVSGAFRVCEFTENTKNNNCSGISPNKGNRLVGNLKVSGNLEVCAKTEDTEDAEDNKCNNISPKGNRLNSRLDVHGIIRECNSKGTICNRVTAASSRTFKKNIKLFKKTELALQDILNTPLFTFEYKDEHPDKSRMGIIAEELPNNLQLKEKPVRPDWPSIYGTLWAGSKALYKQFSDFKKAVNNKTEQLHKTFQDIKGELAGFRKEVWLKFKTLIKEFAEFKTDTQNKLSDTQNKLSDTQNKLSDTQNKLSDTQNKLSDTQNKLQQTDKHSRKNTTELNNLKEENTKLKTKLNTVYKEITETKSENVKLNKKLADVKKESADIKQNLQDQITKELQETKTQFSKTITDLKRELTNIKQSLPKPSSKK